MAAINVQLEEMFGICLKCMYSMPQLVLCTHVQVRAVHVANGSNVFMNNF